MLTNIFLTIFSVFTLFIFTDSSYPARNLFNEIFKNRKFNPKIRPAVKLDTPMIMYMNLSLSQILEVNVKNQVLVLNVWVHQEWEDNRFVWNPEHYGGVSQLQLPADLIWLPDLVLYNNAGDNWDLSAVTGSKVLIRHNGKITWKPPVILKSQCDMDVTYFPFDIQTCQLKMGTWTHNGYLIDLRHTAQKPSDIANNRVNFDNCQSTISYAMDLSHYLKSFEWDLLDASAVRNIKKYPCCPEPYLDVTFQIKIRRMTLFYGLNLICPCLCISFLAVMVFYLPSNSAQKMTLCISVFLGLHIFVLVVFDLTPSSSRSIPLIVEYLLFTMLMVTMSSITSIGIVHVTFKQPETNVMPQWVRRIFLQKLPPYIRLTPMKFDDTVPVEENDENNETAGSSLKSTGDWSKWTQLYHKVKATADGHSHPRLTHIRAKLAMESLRSIRGHFQSKKIYDDSKDEWMFLGIVLDRLLLMLFSSLVTVGALVIFLKPPQLWSKLISLSSDDAYGLQAALNYTRMCK